MLVLEVISVVWRRGFWKVEHQNMIGRPPFDCRLMLATKGYL